jgi:hypothetical protein
LHRQWSPLHRRRNSLTLHITRLARTSIDCCRNASWLKLKASILDLSTHQRRCKSHMAMQRIRKAILTQHPEGLLDACVQALGGSGSRAFTVATSRLIRKLIGNRSFGHSLTWSAIRTIMGGWRACMPEPIDHLEKPTPHPLPRAEAYLRMRGINGPPLCRRRANERSLC